MVQQLEVMWGKVMLNELHLLFLSLTGGDVGSEDEDDLVIFTPKMLIFQ